MDNAASRLIDDGIVVGQALSGCPVAVAAVSQMGGQKRALAFLVYRAWRRYPQVLFRAMMEGWSVTKVRFELLKLPAAEILGPISGETRPTN